MSKKSSSGRHTDGASSSEMKGQGTGLGTSFPEMKPTPVTRAPRDQDLKTGK